MLRKFWLFCLFCVWCLFPSVLWAQSDLVVDSVSGIPSVVKTADLIQAKVCVRNKGATAAGNVKVAIFLSKDAEVTTFDTKLTEDTIVQLVKDGTSCPTLSFRLSQTSAANELGKRWLAAIADWDNKTAELVENNNTSQTLEISIPGPDLQISVFSGLPKIPPKVGDTINLQVCVKNAGSLDVISPFDVGVYYSVDSVLSARFDTKLKEFPVSSLRAGGQFCQNLSVQVPAQANIATGYLGAIADYAEKIAEEDENNNSKGEALTPRPDLVIEAIKGVPASAKAGSVLSLQICVKNIGNADASAFVTGIYFSDNEIITFSDLRIADVSFASGLSAGGQSCQNANVTLPAQIIKLGQNFIGAFADREEKIQEYVENNNTASQPFSNPAPDLVVVSVQGMPVEARPGESYNVTLCVSNLGDDDARSDFKVYLYHSTDGNININDTKLAEVSCIGNPSLGAGKTLCKQAQITLPAVMPIRNNWLGFIVDPDNTVSEINEGNNASFSWVFSNPAPDVLVEAIKGVPQNAGGGSQLSLEACVRNNGSLDISKPFKVALYHSVNADISNLDTKLGEQTIASLKVNALVCVKFAVTLSASYVVPADNWIGAIVDLDNQIEELDETNNNIGVSFSNLAPDLEITSFRGVPQGAAGGSAFYVDICVQNKGSEDANTPFVVTAYYSKDSFITKGDIPMGVSSISSLAKGQSICIVITATLPANLERGTNYVGAMVDSGDTVKELDENNNFTQAASFQDTTLRIDLQIASVTGIPQQANAGDPITVNVCVKNADTSNAQSFKVGLFYSKDVSLSIYNDTQIGTVTFPSGIPGGSTQCLNITGQLPNLINPKPQGNWLGIVVDTELVIPEVNKANNVQVIRFEDAGGFPDLVIDAIKSVPSLGLPGFTFTDIEICVRNLKSAPANPPFNLVMYHSLDKSIDINDTVMTIHAFTKPIGGNAVECVKLTGTLPKKVNAGDNWIGAYIDPDELLKEDKDNNNTKEAKFYIDVPDLVVTEVSGVPKKAEAGDALNVKVCVENKGVKDAGPFKLLLSLTPDNDGKTKDVASTDITAGLAKGKSVCHTYTDKLPSPLDPGRRNLEAFADSDEKVVESDEDNNKKSAEFLVPGPDLTIKTLEATPTFGAAGATIALKVCTENKGSKDVKDAFVVHLYDSEDDVIETTDTKLAEISYTTSDLSKFTAGAKEDCQTVNIKVPATVKEGRRYLGAFVDPDKKIKEEDENNNTTSVAFVVPSATKPNLVAIKITLTPTLQQPGRKVNVEFCFQNYGTDIPTNTDISAAIYFATSKSSVPSLRIHTYPPVKGMLKDASQCVKGDVTLPANLALGKAVLVGWVDYDNNIEESDEADNRTEADIEIYLDRDDDGIPAGVDCDDNDKSVYPSFAGKPAATELCDKKDNDCNGKIDDPFTNLGQPCEVGVGECKAKGVYVCKKDMSGEECDAKAGQPSTEKCNDKDDDCDGKIDNEGDKDCPNSQFCIQGQCQLILCVFNKHCPSGFVCKQGICRRPKSCQKNEDCDTLETCQANVCTQKSCSKHEDCPIDSLCLGEVCAPACKLDDECGVNHLCIDGRCWKTCANANDCHSSQSCLNRQCQDKCTPGCKEGQRCLEQSCVENSCYGYRCPNAQICNRASCGRDPCYQKTCSTGEFCTEGTCRKTCGNTTCQADQICDDGKCRDNACKQAKCSDTEVCILGRCLPLTCQDGSCGTARYCKDNQCADDPCFYVTCSNVQDEQCRLDDEGKAQCVSKKSLPQEEQTTESVVSEATQDASAGAESSVVPEPQNDDSTVSPDLSVPTENAQKPGCGCAMVSVSATGWIWCLWMMVFFVVVSRRRKIRS